MRLTLRGKLLTVVAVNAIALIVLQISDTIIADRVDRDINDVRARYLPKVALRSDLSAELDRMTRAFQDAAAAHDSDLLSAARDSREDFRATVAAVGPSLPADASKALLKGVEEYYRIGLRVSEAVIASDLGDVPAREIEAMQAARDRATELVDQHAGVDQAEVAATFESASATRRSARWLRLAIGGGCLGLVLVLSLWISRNVLRRVGELTGGLARFAEGTFDTRIPAGGRDELGAVADGANQMAANLELLSRARDRDDWLRAGRAGLAQELRGELDPPQVAEQALAFVARYVGAPVAALYYASDDHDELELLGGYALGSEHVVGEARVARGEGIVGQAALSADVVVLADPAGRLRLRSAVVEGEPRGVVLVPLVHDGSVRGVLELAVLDDWSEDHTQLVRSVGENIAIAVEVARGRAATRALLAETRAKTQALEEQRVALEDTNAELVSARRRLEHKAVELAAASRYKSLFLANMSHELRTPLNAIIGFAELMYDGVVPPGSPQQKEFLGDVLTSGRHLLQLINDVLDLSKVEAGKLEFRPEPVDLDRIIGEVLAILRTTAAERRLVVDFEVDPAIGEVVLDPARLKQVLYNYVSNALKFTNEGGQVHIRAVAAGGDRFRLEVKDTGIGISAEDQDRLFGEFQQIGGTEAQRIAGTGLGLALTKRLVETQGGSVGVHSELGVGSTFFAELPRKAKRAPVVPEAQTEPAPVGAPAVLVIEDDPRDQRELIDALSGAGYEVEVCSTGAQAVERCRARRFDAITLDMLLPDMSGVQVLRQLRSQGLNRTVPVIVITVVAEPGAVAGFAVHDLLPKPLQKPSLLEALARAELHPNTSDTVLVIDDDHSSRSLMTAMLEQSGYQATTASDGEQGLALAREVVPSAIVLDLLMPGMDGFEFLDRLRADPVAQRVPVFIWTVMDLDSAARARLRASAQGVLSKGNGGCAAVVAQLAAFLPPPQQPDDIGVGA